ncbi:metallophosphoesterase family protein [Christensenellaceae bacterium OttesenSCG-928-L17]|nr:metallophosphoesterase family protein [Christensenellaceae bacterium OttesenSCG-928-L17]
MRIKRILALILVITLLLGASNIAAAAKDDPWYAQNYWETEQLIALGAELPYYNAATAQYEISKPEQLLYLSGLWKVEDTNGDGVPDAPFDGDYVLTADLDMAPLMKAIGARISKEAGEKREGFMPPIGSETDQDGKEATDTKCAFFGTFDGQGHAIRNLRVERMKGKYAGMFGNIGHDFGEGYVRNLALLDMTLYAKSSCGLLAGAVYGDVENCVITGTIVCNEKTAGGIAGKIKKNENGYVGIARNCFVYVDIEILGLANENGACGGITSSQSGGGAIENCYVGGSILVKGEKAESVAGISGNLNGGQIPAGTVMAMQSILVESGTDVGLFAGNYSGESGDGAANNYVWNGTQLTGNVTSDHPEEAMFTSVDAGTLLSKAFYANTVGWDFDKDWSWVGAEDKGIPMPQPFAPIGEPFVAALASDLVVTAPVLRASEPMKNNGYSGETVALTATLLLPEQQSGQSTSVTLHYGTEKDGTTFTKSVPMDATGDGSYAVNFPETAEGDWYYYFEAAVGSNTLTFPSNPSIALRLTLQAASAKKTPKYITLSPGATYDTVGIAWVTEEDGLQAKLQYRQLGSNENWVDIDVTDIQTRNQGARGNITGYAADIEKLLPASAYEYQVITFDAQGEYVSEVGSFTTLPADNTFSFVVISDLQTTVEEGYLPYLHTLNGYFAETLGDYDFTINLGDLTEDNSPAQWRNLFGVLSEHYANSLTAFAPGNHEHKADPLYQMFKAVTNAPAGMDDAYIGESTGSFTVGDVCFVLLNTDPFTGIEGADAKADKQAFYEAQKVWAKEVFEASGCRWRIVSAHAGLIQDDAWATSFLEEMCDELDVDLYFNGHIHNYYRATVNDGVAAEVGEGTTFITTSPMGCKFDDYVPGVIDELLQFQTGGASDARQYFTHVEAGENGLTVTAYQRVRNGDITLPKQFLEYEPIDTISLTESLSVKRGNYRPAGGQTNENPNPAEETPGEAEQSSGTSVWLWVGIAVVIAAVGGVILMRRRKEGKGK